MHARLRSFFYFLLAAGAVLLVLKTLNWLPQVFQQGTMRRYATLEEVRKAVTIRDLYVPAYYPQDISWPPTEVLAQTTPYPAVIQVYSRSGTPGAALVITQAASDRFPFDRTLVFSEIRESVPYQLNGRAALLEVGACSSGEACSRISWQEGDHHVSVIMRSSPFELIRIAASMLPWPH